VLSVVRLHSVPVGRRNQNQNLGAPLQRRQRARRVEGRRFQGGSGCFHHAFHLPAKFLNMLLQSLRGTLAGSLVRCHIGKRLEVMVIEQGEIAAETSGAAGGLISQLSGIVGPAPLTDLMLESWSLFAPIIPELEAASDVDIEYRQTDCLRVALDVGESESLRQQVTACQARGIDMQWLTTFLPHEFIKNHIAARTT